MGQGGVTIAATARDAAGNISAQTSRNITIDTIPPTPAINRVTYDNTLDTIRIFGEDIDDGTIDLSKLVYDWGIDPPRPLVASEFIESSFDSESGELIVRLTATASQNIKSNANFAGINNQDDQLIFKSGFLTDSAGNISDEITSPPISFIWRAPPTSSAFFVGGSGDDVIVGSNLNDTLRGGLGADTLTGLGGADIFVFESSAESSATVTDHITDFVAGTDKIKFSSVDSVQEAGTVEGADLSAAVKAAFEEVTNDDEAIEAVLFTFNGKSYVAVENAVAGNHIDALVIEITGVKGTLAPTDFIA